MMQSSWVKVARKSFPYFMSLATYNRNTEYQLELQAKGMTREDLIF